MGRARSFDEDTVVGLCAAAFLRTGYEGTSIDDLVTASGLHRGSLYKAFGSKRGLFLAALGRLSGEDVRRPAGLDLLLVALLELAPRDAEVRDICTRLLSPLGLTAGDILGRRMLDRADITLTERKAHT